MKFHRDLSLEPVDLEWLRIELLPGAPYSVRHTRLEHTVGIAIERQRGSHAFGSDRLQDFDTWTGTLAYTPPQLETRSESDQGGEYLALRFQDAATLGWSVPVRRLERRPSFDGQRKLLDVALRLRRALMVPSFEPEELNVLAVRMILLAQQVIQDARVRAPTDPMSRLQIARVLERIEADIAEPLRLAELAATAGLPLLRFVRSFTRAVGLTPHAYVVERRLQRARWMLRHSKISLAEAAVACGFVHQSHLGAALKRAIGLTPRQLRERMIPCVFPDRHFFGGYGVPSRWV
jgi:AraC family transcriptional regulator